MVNDLKEVIKSIIRGFYIIILLYIVYQVLRALYGGTWSTENIIIGGMGAILAGFFVIFGLLVTQNKCIGTLEERTKNVGKSLTQLGNDFKQHISRHKYKNQ